MNKIFKGFDCNMLSTRHQETFFQPVVSEFLGRVDSFAKPLFSRVYFSLMQSRGLHLWVNICLQFAGKRTTVESYQVCHAGRLPAAAGQSEALCTTAPGARTTAAWLRSPTLGFTHFGAVPRKLQARFPPRHPQKSFPNLHWHLLVKPVPLRCGAELLSPSQLPHVQGNKFNPSPFHFIR